MVFQKNNKRINKFNYHPIDIISPNTYLGITISASGNLIRTGTELLSEQADYLNISPLL